MKPLVASSVLLLSCAVHEDAPPWLFGEDDPIGVELPAPRSAPPPFAMSLGAGHLVAGAYAVLEVEGAPANTLIRIAYGRRLGDGPCVAQLGGACLDIESPVRVAMFAAHSDAAGHASVAFRVPQGRPEGVPVAIQAVADGADPAVSNPIHRLVGLRGTNIQDDVDLDGDGYTPAQGDCADFDAAWGPGEADDVGDGMDRNCDDSDGEDLDHDGHASEASGGDDCADDEPGAQPGAVEVCDGFDDDCDGLIDPPSAVGAGTWYPDADGDLFGAASGGVVACAAPAGHVASHTDCDDARAAVRPGAAEVCNAFDDDCDGDLNEGMTASAVVYSYTGAHQAFTAPAWANSVHVDAWGAAGAGSGNTWTGGPGGYAGGDVAVTGGEALIVVVGGGGTRPAGQAAHYAGGCGLSGLFTGTYTQAGALLVAGGGGGVSFCGPPTDIPGGGGGGVAGASGVVSCSNNSNMVGRGGTATAGGVGAPAHVSGSAAGAGGALTGGTGGDFRNNAVASYGGGGAGGIGGGGGGGYWGGGGGGHQSGVDSGRGGGGSGFLHATRVTNGELVLSTTAAAPRNTLTTYGGSAGLGQAGNVVGAHGRVVVQARCVP